MATGGLATERPTGSEGSSVKLFITSYTDDFFAEREYVRREVTCFMLDNYLSNAFSL